MNVDQQFVLLQVVQTARNAISSQIARGRCQDTACLTQAADGDVAVGLVLARKNGYVYVVVNDVQEEVGGLQDRKSDVSGRRGLVIFIFWGGRTIKKK